MLKLNKTFTFLAVSILLSACGGGNDGGSQNNETASKKIPDGTNLYLLDYMFFDKTDKFTSQKMTIQNNQILGSDSNQPLDEYILTSKKLYTPNKDIAQNVMQINSETDWTFNFVGDIKENYKFDSVDLSGKNMFDTILPGYRSLGFDDIAWNDNFNARNFLTSYDQKVFPDGSRCYRIKSQKTQVSYFSFDPENSDYLNETFTEKDLQNRALVDKLNNDSLQNPLKLSYRYASGVWNDIPWSVIYSAEHGGGSMYNPVVEYNGGVLFADYTSDLEWNVLEEIKHFKKILNNQNISDFQVRNNKLNIAKLESGCQFYNETAAKALFSLSSIKWVDESK